MTKKVKDIPVKMTRTEGEAMPMELWRRDLPFWSRFEPRRPFGMMRSLADDLESMLGGFRFGSELPRFLEFDPFDRTRHELMEWVPPFETFEQKGRWIVRAELPGIEKDDIVIELNDKFLTVKGKREQKFEEEKEGFYRSEFTYGNFFRRLPLPEGVETKDTKATFNNGVLEISLAAPHLVPKNKRIEITEGEPRKMTAKA